MTKAEEFAVRYYIKSLVKLNKEKNEYTIFSRWEDGLINLFEEMKGASDEKK